MAGGFSPILGFVNSFRSIMGVSKQDIAKENSERSKAETLKKTSDQSAIELTEKRRAELDAAINALLPQ